MIERLIRLCARHPWLTIALTSVLVFLAGVGLRRVPLDAIPDLSDAQVIVFAEWAGQSPDLIEDQVTYPLVTRLLAVPDVKYVRGFSMPGASQIIAVFEEGADLAKARARVGERLASASGILPSGVTPEMGPEATSVGWVFQYALVDKTGARDLAQLRSFQDWQLRFALQSVPGVAEVAAVGGFVKQYQIDVDPRRLQHAGLSPLQVARAVRNANHETSGASIEMGGSSFVVRGRGYVRTLDDIRKIPVLVRPGGDILRVGDVATVQVGPASRSGIGELDGEGEAVGGIVVMRLGANALEVIRGVKAKIDSLRESLPTGVEIVTVYDRSDLISRVIATLDRAVIEEMLIVALVIGLFLWHLRASLVALISLPVAVLLSFLPMLLGRVTVNIMSLGGIALAIGTMVDSAIVMTENACKKLEGRDTREMPEEERRRIIIDAMCEMGRPLFFALLVITVSFLPIFALEGREGKLFGPLAFTKTAAMAWAAVLAVTLVPALAVLALRGRFVAEHEHPVSTRLYRWYGPIIEWTITHRWKVIGAAALAMLATIPIAWRLPTEFMPALQEGSILYMPTASPGMSPDTAAGLLQTQDRLIMSQPEVERVFGKAGRAATATDPAPMNMFETVVTLKPKSQWRPGMTYEKIVAELDRKLDFPGMPNIWWMPIQTRLEMLSTGIRTALGIKVFGPDAESVERLAIEVEGALRELPGTTSVYAERTQQGGFVDIGVKRDLAAAYGLSVAEVHAVVEAAMGGINAGQVIEGRERYPIRLRFARDDRDTVEAMGKIAIPAPGGRFVSLGEIASIDIVTGPAMRQSENARAMAVVSVTPRSGESLSGYVAKARDALRAKVRVPSGMEVVFTGQYESYERARERLLWIVPVVLFAIILLLYWNTRSGMETAIVLLAVPGSLVGAFWLLWALGYKVSTAVWVGIIALAGLDAETGVVMLLYLTQAWSQRGLKDGAVDDRALREVIHEGAVQRVRPKLMTVSATLLGLLPVMWATGAGSEVMKRIAAPMVGGVVTSGLIELLVYPAIFAAWKSGELGWKRRGDGARHSEGARH